MKYRKTIRRLAISNFLLIIFFFLGHANSNAQSAKIDGCKELLNRNPFPSEKVEAYKNCLKMVEAYYSVLLDKKTKEKESTREKELTREKESSKEKEPSSPMLAKEIQDNKKILLASYKKILVYYKNKSDLDEADTIQYKIDSLEKQD